MNRYRAKPLLLFAALTLAACSEPPLQSETAAPLCEADHYDVLGGVNLQTATVLEVQQAMSRGAFTSEDLVRHQLKLIETLDRAGPALNSIRAIAPSALEQARAADARRAAGQTRGRLDGVTVLLKDNIGTTDLPTTAGSIALATNIPLREATLTRRLREAGAIILGKANMAEFANWMDPTMPNGYSSLGGQVLAPYDLARNPSGSSSGSAVAATMGFCSVAVGTETAGSIIAPSWTNSLVGVKPTLGLVSRIGVIPLSPSFDTAGPMTRTVTDAAALLGALAYADAEDPVSQRFLAALNGEVPDYVAALSTTALGGARLGVREIDATPQGQATAAYSSELFNRALEILRAEGAEIVTISDSLYAADAVVPVAGGLVANFNEFKFTLNRYLAEESGPDTFVETLGDIIEYNEQHPDTVKYGQSYLQLSDAQTGSEMDPVYVVSRDAAILSAQTWMDNVMEAYDLDAIVTWDGGNGGIGLTNMAVTATAGYPNVTVPIGYLDQIPHGLEIGGRPFDEAQLLAYAYDFEQASQLRRSPPQINPALLGECR